MRPVYGNPVRTYDGKRAEWQVPEHSGNSTDWGKWSMALLVQKLIGEGVQCEWA